MDEGWWRLMEKEVDADLLLVANYRRYLYSSNYSTAITAGQAALFYHV